MSSHRLFYLTIARAFITIFRMFIWSRRKLVTISIRMFISSQPQDFMACFFFEVYVANYCMPSANRPEPLKRNILTKLDDWLDGWMYNFGRPLICNVFSCFILEVLVPNRAATESAVSAQRLVEHVKCALRNISTERMPHSVYQESNRIKPGNPVPFL